MANETGGVLRIPRTPISRHLRIRTHRALHGHSRRFAVDDYRVWRDPLLHPLHQGIHPREAGQSRAAGAMCHPGDHEQTVEAVRLPLDCRGRRLGSRIPPPPFQDRFPIVDSLTRRHQPVGPAVIDDQLMSLRLKGTVGGDSRHSGQVQAWRPCSVVRSKSKVRQSQSLPRAHLKSAHKAGCRLAGGVAERAQSCSVPGGTPGYIFRLFRGFMGPA